MALGIASSFIVGGILVSPNTHKVGKPSDNLNTETFTLKSKSGSLLSGWHTNPNGISKGVIVILHGIRGSRLNVLNRIQLLHEHGYSTVSIDLQAHGESSGKNITLGYLEKYDVQAAVQFARIKYPNKKIGLIGVSLGGAASILASPLNIDALVIESVYSDIKNAVYNRVAIRLGIFSYIPTKLLLSQLKPRLGISASDLIPLENIPNVNCPIFIISGEIDMHTKISETESLFATAKEPKQKWVIKNAKHEDLQLKEPLAYAKKVTNFFDQHLQDN